jgi:hypothetical protein
VRKRALANAVALSLLLALVTACGPDGVTSSAFYWRIEALRGRQPLSLPVHVALMAYQADGRPAGRKDPHGGPQIIAPAETDQTTPVKLFQRLEPGVTTATLAATITEAFPGDTATCWAELAGGVVIEGTSRSATVPADSQTALLSCTYIVKGGA